LGDLNALFSESKAIAEKVPDIAKLEKEVKW